MPNDQHCRFSRRVNGHIELVTQVVSYPPSMSATVRALEREHAVAIAAGRRLDLPNEVAMSAGGVQKSDGHRLQGYTAVIYNAPRQPTSLSWRQGDRFICWPEPDEALSTPHRRCLPCLSPAQESAS